MHLSCRNMSFPFTCVPRLVFGLPNLKEPAFEMLKCHKQMPSLQRPLINWTFLHPKWKEPLPQISSGCQCIAIKRTRRSGALWKPLGSELSGIKTHQLQPVSVVLIFHPLFVHGCAAKPVLGWSPSGWRAEGLQTCELLMLFNSLHFYFPGRLSQLPSGRHGAIFWWVSISRWIPPQNPA